MAKWAGFSDEQSRQLDALVTGFRAELAKLAAPDRVLDRRGSGTAIRPRPGDVIRAQAGDVVVLPHPRSAKGREPVVVLVESQPVSVLAESGTVNDVARVVVTVVGAMEWWSTGTEWWGSAVGGSGGAGGSPGVIPDQTVLGNDSGADAVATPITVHQELDWLLAAGSWVFDGVDDVITMTDVLGKERTDSFSMSFWIQTASVNGFAIGKFATVPTTRGYAAQMVSGKLRFVLSSTNTTSVLAVETVTAFNDNVLRNCVMTYNGTSLASGVAIYVNGVAQATVTIFNNLTTTTLAASTFTLGPLGAVAGTLQHLAMWSDDLTAAEAAEVYGGGVPPDLLSVSCAADLEGWWKVDGSDVTGAGGVADHSVNANVGTAGGGLGTGGSTIGSLPVRGSAVWELLTPGTVDLPLVSNGLGFKPAYERLANAGLATMTAHTYKGNNTGSTASATDVAISGLAGAGMTATGSTLNVIGSTSITVNADDIQRPALTGAITASANSNTTAFGSAAAKSVLANATNGSAVPAFLAGTGAFQYLRVNSANTALEWAVLSLASFPTMAAGSFLANVTAGVAVPTAHDLATFAGAGLTYTNGTGILAVGAGTHIVANANDITLDLTTLVAAIDSTSIASTGTTLVREALTGEVTAATNSNTTTITRSTAFTWTGSHTFAGTGTAFAVNVDNASSIDVASSFQLLTSGSCVYTHGGDSSMSVTGSLDVLASTDITLDADDAVFILGSGILQVGDGVIEGYVRMQASATSDPSVASNEGMFWVLDEGSTTTVPAYTSDDNTDYRIKLTGSATVIDVSGTVNNAAITNTTSAIQCTAATTINGIAPGYNGQALDIFMSGNNNLTINHASGSATGSQLALRGSAAYGPLARGGMRVIYDEADVVWREVARA
jgi:hypothetical protein